MRNRLPEIRLPAVAFAASAVTILICMALPTGGATRTLALVAVAAAVGALLAALLSIGWHSLRHVRLVRRLDALSVPAVQAGVPVRELSGIGMPFVAGIRRPEIYCPPALSARLNGPELGAVLLHEQRHVADRAPARLLFLSAMASLVPRAAVQGWLEAQRARLEIDADRYAMERGASRATLASALLKLVEQPGPAGTSGFTSSSELRLRALLGEYEPAAARGRHLAAALAAIVVAVGCLVFYLS